ncbi:sigma factor G inhibitor Gin [Thalassorhabdus alkalitolerans]|uniref:Sigma factor G inhibitor Gin n=1 Tax=Thalassorhabdus alkalitolerans TaxID=2282697 RepID=A0ABW0YSQ0_9BACI|nr:MULTISPECIES: sigma factor G inhibitor Gin [Bacillaceae]
MKPRNESDSSVTELCLICERKKEKGIHIVTAFICSECEQDIVQATTEDPNYRFYIERLREIKTNKLTS